MSGDDVKAMVKAGIFATIVIGVVGAICRGFGVDPIPGLVALALVRTYWLEYREDYNGSRQRDRV